MEDSAGNVVRWLIACVAALAVVALLAWGDRDAGVDDRDTDPADVEITSDAAPAPLLISIGME